MQAEEINLNEIILKSIDENVVNFLQNISQNVATKHCKKVLIRVLGQHDAQPFGIFHFTREAKSFAIGSVGAKIALNQSIDSKTGI